MSYNSEVQETFAVILRVGGKSNSLGRAAEVLDAILNDRSHLEELYACLFEDDPWLVMRAVDCLEKVCRIHPDWLEPYIDRMLSDLTTSKQPSVQWHLAQMLGEVNLSATQQSQAITWLTQILSSEKVDWIVAANAMDTLAQYTRNGSFTRARLLPLIDQQLKHHSKSVVKRAAKLRGEFAGI